MSTYRDIVYMCLDLIKGSSDDQYIEEEHIIFLASKLRATLLKSEVEKPKSRISQSNYQTICLNLEPIEALCSSGKLKSKEEVPTIISSKGIKVFIEDFYDTNISLVSHNRMKFVGTNKYLKNIIYASIGPDNHLYLTSGQEYYKNIENVKMTALFEDVEKASLLECNTDLDTSCDILDKTFPLENSIVPSLIELIVKEILGSAYRPKDNTNDANDGMSDMATFLAKNTKNDLQKTLAG